MKKFSATDHNGLAVSLAVCLWLTVRFLWIEAMPDLLLDRFNLGFRRPDEA
jgi:hypothetical protein